MAFGSESPEYRLVSGARSGLKREFAFALQNQTDFNGLIGRTRGKKSQSPVVVVGGDDEASENQSSKRLKVGDIKEAEVSGNDVFVKGDDENLTCREGSDSKSVKLPVSESVDVDPGKSGTIVESEKSESENAEVSKEAQGEGKLEVTPVVDETYEGQNVALEKPLRRFTRSLLKPQEEQMEVSVSGSTASEDGSSLNSSSRTRMEMKMSKKIALKKLPGNVRDLFETGLLEGLPVRYRFSNKKEAGLHGTIKDSGILCGCYRCNGEKVVTSYEFERHAGSSQKHASNNIYLENGKSLRDVLNACRNTPMEAYEDSIKNALASLPEAEHNLCKKCKGPLSSTHASKRMQFCESCLVEDDSLGTQARVCVSNTRLAKSTVDPTSSDSSSVPSSSQIKRGKITRKDLRLHKLVFEEDGLPDGTALTYFVRGLKVIEGYKKGLGIFCYHCNSEVSPSQFESHAGYGSRRKPYLNIYTSNGVSLHELAVSMSKSRKLSGNDNDDICNYCHEFGDLLCCDMCPRAFHQECVGLSSIPEDKWYCPCCVNMYEREKCCEYNANAVAAGRVSGVDPIEQITNRCIRIVETNEPGGCTICRLQTFSKEFGPNTVMICDQCENEYHVGCLPKEKVAGWKAVPVGDWFCCRGCEFIHTALRKLSVKGAEKIPESFLHIVKEKKEEDTDMDIRWFILRGKTAFTLESKPLPETTQNSQSLSETNQEEKQSLFELAQERQSLLEKAINIFHERFSPIIDAKTGRDFIPAMVKGEKIGDQDFSGMYTAVLTVNSSVVSAGILRVFGKNIAELPLVATSTESEGRGYFHLLFTCLQSLFGFLNVKHTVLPSADESKAIWTDKFEFTPVPADQLAEYKKNSQMMVFTGTSLLHKPVPVVRIKD